MLSQEVQYFGHRGCRGLYPENTVEGFKKAINLGVDGIELDVVVNKDKQLVISHEGYMSSTICLDSLGNKIDNEKQHNLYKMAQSEIEKYDCGTLAHPKFTEQRNVTEKKPLLRDFFRQTDLSKTVILFEIKSEKGDEGIFQPSVEEYVEIILRELNDFQWKKNIIFMSFDARILNEINRQTQEYRMVYLTYLPFRSVKKFLKDIDFKPHALGMFFPTIKKRKVKKAQRMGIRIFAWTVNDASKSQKLVKMGVTGIITDYPDRVAKEKS
jgi:glycerophosphoryl diester phosphodiesterase